MQVVKGPSWEKMALWICAICQPSNAPAQPCNRTRIFPFHCMDSDLKYSTWDLWKFWSDCRSVQVDLSLLGLHVSKGPFSHNLAHTLIPHIVWCCSMYFARSQEKNEMWIFTLQFIHKMHHEKNCLCIHILALSSENLPSDICDQWRFRLAYASWQSDQPSLTALGVYTV